MNFAIVGRVAGHFDENKQTWSFAGSAYAVTQILCQYVDPLHLFVVMPFGQDEAGNALRATLHQWGVQVFCLPLSTTPLVTFDESQKEKWELFNYDEELTPAKLQGLSEILLQVKVGFLDLDAWPVLQALFALAPNLPWIAKPSSDHYVAMGKKIVPYLYAAKLNKEEASLLAGFPIYDIHDCPAVEERLKKLGLKRAFITLSKDGVYYYDEHSHGHIKSQAVTKRKTTAAGDAFLAGVLYGFLLTKDMALVAKQGIEKSAALLHAVALRSFKDGDHV